MHLLEAFGELDKLYSKKQIQEGIFDNFKNRSKKPVDDDLGLKQDEVGSVVPKVSVVDLIIKGYESGIFQDKLKGAKKGDAFYIDLSGLDSTRLSAYFNKKPEFKKEFHNEAGVYSTTYKALDIMFDIFETFVSIHKPIAIYESLETKLSEGLSREECIAIIKDAGFKYKFEKYSDAQLFRIAQRVEAETPVQRPTPKVENPRCEVCHTTLTDAGECPVCDLGDETALEENIIKLTVDELKKLVEE